MKYRYSIWGLLFLFAVALCGFGVGGMLRPPTTLTATKAVLVDVDSPPVRNSRLAAVTIVSDDVKGYGCQIKSGNCECDSPYGTVLIPQIADCDVVRYKLWR